MKQITFTPPHLLWLGLVSCLALPCTATETDTESRQPPLVFSYWEEAQAPFVERSNGDVTGGLLRSIADAFAQSIGYRPELKELPVKRVEPEFIAGNVGVTCLTHPQWWNQPSFPRWTDPLLSDGDALVVRVKDAPDYGQLEQLNGRTIGLFRSYEYEAGFMKMLNQGLIRRLDLVDQNRGFELLLLNRIDAQVEFHSVARHLIHSQGLQDQLTVAPYMIERFDLSCAVHPDHASHLPRFNKAISQLRTTDAFIRLQPDS